MASLLAMRAPAAQGFASRCASTSSPVARLITRSPRLFSTSTASRPTQLLRQQRLSQPRIISRRTYATAQPAHAAPGSNLPWNTFFAVRRTRRAAGFVCGIVGAVTAVTIGAPMIGQYEVDTQIASALGIDSIYALAGASVLVVILGYATGRAVSGLGFAAVLRIRGWNQSFMEKENSLLHRIKRYRADATNSSPQNPPPDYYGEKIKNVAGYRQWQKDQKIYAKKMYRDKLPES